MRQAINNLHDRLNRLIARLLYQSTVECPLFVTLATMATFCNVRGGGMFDLRIASLDRSSNLSSGTP